MSGIWSKTDQWKLIYRLPFYILLSTSAVFFTLDYLLYDSAGRDDQIYSDAAIRLGMSSPVIGVFVIAMITGTVLLGFATIVLISNAVSEKRFDWSALCFVVLGILVHPWILGIVLGLFIRPQNGL